MPANFATTVNKLLHNTRATKEVLVIQKSSEASFAPVALPAGEDNTNSGRSTLAAIGCWSVDVRLLQLPSLQLVVTEPLGGEVIPRSALLSDFEGQPYLLVGLGDGGLMNWRLDPNKGGLAGERGEGVMGFQGYGFSVWPGFRDLRV